MIGQLRGTLLTKQPPLLLIDVNGVGYEVFAPMSTFYQLPAINETITLLTHLVVREDAQLLYGFYAERERELFRALIKVNGVGPKLALTILSGIEPDAFVQCVQANDANRLVNIPGIGKKTAERLIVETRDALMKWDTGSIAATPASIAAHGERQISEDAISALTALGYKLVQAKRAIGLVQHEANTSEELIRLALKQMLHGVS